MRTIILDTSFLLDAVQWKVDVFTELERICDFQYHLAILDKTLDELHGKKEEKLIKQIIAKKKVGILQTAEGYVDDLIAGMQGKDLIIATHDRGLKRRLSCPIISIRQKKYLILTGA